MTRSVHLGGGLVIATVLATLLGCDPVLGSETTGDLIDPPREREHPLEEIAEVCGTSGSTLSPIVRRPYVQRVTDDGVSILWVSEDDPESVEIWAPGATPRSVTSEVDATTFLDVGVQRSVRVGGLEPARVHCYQLVRDGEVVFGPTGFRTAPSADDLGAIDVLVFGDSGKGSAEQVILREQMDTVPADLILHTGDVAYESGTLRQFERWVFGIYDGLFEATPFYPSIGNHDHRTAEAGPYREAFDLPTNADSDDPSDLERRYSFDWGPAHFVALDTKRMDEEHAEWLDRDLAATDRPWKIVYGHHPPYSSGKHGSSRRIRELVQPVLERHGVQVFFGGHDHHYERTEALGGVTYVVTGAGGDTEPTGSSSFTAYASEAIHFVSLHVDGSELRAYAVDGTGRVFDSFRLTI